MNAYFYIIVVVVVVVVKKILIFSTAIASCTCINHIIPVGNTITLCNVPDTGLETKDMQRIIMAMNNMTTEDVLRDGVLVESLADIRGPIQNYSNLSVGW